MLKALETQGVANKDCLSGDHLLLVNLYRHLLEECLTAGAADMNRHRAIVQLIQSRRSLVSFPLKLTCLFAQSLNLQRLRQVSTSLFKSSVIKTWSRVFIGEQILLVTPIISVSQKNLAPRSRPLSKSYPDSSSSPYLSPRLNSKHHSPSAVWLSAYLSDWILTPPYRFYSG